MAKKGKCAVNSQIATSPGRPAKKPASPFRGSSTGYGRTKPAKAGQQNPRRTNP